MFTRPATHRRHRARAKDDTRTPNRARIRRRLAFTASAGLLALATLTGATALSAPAHAVVGGSAAASGRYPFMVSLRENGFPYCGGTLVAPQWVLTAAHCATDRAVTVLTAVVDQAAINGSGGEVSGVDYIVIDPAYNSASEAYDVALLHLSTPATGIAAPTLIASGDATTDAPGVVATVIGYGSTAPQSITGAGSISYPADLQQAAVPIVTDSRCSAVFNGRDEPAVHTDVMLCAGGDGKHDACVGDSGGPLLVPGAHPGTWTEVALTSWGAGCAVPGVPGVYTRLADPQIAAFVSGTVATP